jgi:hypothetical protein
MSSPIAQYATAKLRVRVVDATGAGVTGLAHSAIGLSAKISKGAASAAFTLSPSNWAESNDGVYYVTLANGPGGDTNTLGACLLTVIYNLVPYFAPFDVVSSDANAQLTALTSSVATVDGVVDAIKLKTDLIPAVPASSTHVTNAQASIQGSLASTQMSLTEDINNARDAVMAALVALPDVPEENTVRAVLTRDGSNRALTSRFRVYDSAANADIDDGVTGLVAAYLATATYHASGMLDTYKVTKV